MRRAVITAALLFAFAAVLRVLFVTATPDVTAPFGAFYKGDAAVWVNAALAEQAGVGRGVATVFRPPGMATWLDWIWDLELDALRTARLLQALAGALLAAVVYLGFRRWSEFAGVFAGAWTACSTGPIYLASSLNNEVPYLLLVFGTLPLLERARERRSLLLLCGFGALQGIACLIRAEHLLFTAVAVIYGAGSIEVRLHRISAVAAALFAVGLVTLPWHVTAWERVTTFNTTESPRRGPTTMPWDPAARQAIDSMPGFVRAASQRFVEAVAVHRGRTRVAAGDPEAWFDEAFGTWPEPLPETFFVAVYGGMNFALANTPEADGGFNRDLLDRAPILAGGRSAWPPHWLAALPQRGALQLEYPPHVELLADGYAVGLDAILDSPGRWAGLVVDKLERFASGAANGLGGSVLPFGEGGLRRRVDLVIDDSSWAWVWRFAVLGVAAVGVLLAARAGAGRGAVLWAASVTVVAAAFFGYARHGAMLTPVIGFGLGWICMRWGRRGAVTGIVVALLVLVVDVWRAVDPPRVEVDGKAVDAQGDGWPWSEFEERRVEVK